MWLGLYLGGGMFGTFVAKEFYKCIADGCKSDGKKGGSVGKPETETKHGYLHYYYSGKRGGDYEGSKFILAREEEDGRWKRYKPDSLPNLRPYGNGKSQIAKPLNRYRWEDIVLTQTPEVGKWMEKMAAYRQKIRRRTSRQADE